ncbi:MAG: hypothetical protein EP329_09300 [Deltaproteobacteria bacterium]|nr:MAG: hypothetical protein EP329_09300 [Deltaproteobacteria bacterium]
MDATASCSTSAASCDPRRGARGLALTLVVAALAVAGPVRAAGPSLVGTPHDLSLGGLRGAGTESPEVCVFCHVPHGASGDGPLWHAPVARHAYTVYASATLDAAPDQPDGDSKLCLSCHDGTLASPIAPGTPNVRRAGAASPLPVTGTNLGTDLSDDHPVSFVYDAGLAARDGQLATPERAPSPLGGTVASDLLDARRKLQCTACHDAHDNSHGAFLRVDDRDDRLCASCHTLRDFSQSAHAASQAPELSAGCATCHTPHGASHDTTLLVAPQRELCGRCHATQARAMAPGATTRHAIDALEGGGDGARPMSCATCHEPHVVKPARLYERQHLTDPDDTARPHALVPERETPYGYADSPPRALSSDAAFCLDCHDGSWPGAVNIQGELASPRVVLTGFAIDRVNLHATHAAPTALRSDPIGCTYCHDAHGTGGNSGVPRGRLLYPWLEVRTFPYRGKASCWTRDAAQGCHTIR